jgi:hypothetical protein
MGLSSDKPLNIIQLSLEHNHASANQQVPPVFDGLADPFKVLEGAEKLCFSADRLEMNRHGKSCGATWFEGKFWVRWIAILGAKNSPLIGPRSTPE